MDLVEIAKGIPSGLRNVAKNPSLSEKLDPVTHNRVVAWRAGQNLGRKKASGRYTHSGGVASIERSMATGKAHKAEYREITGQNERPWPNVWRELREKKMKG